MCQSQHWSQRHHTQNAQAPRKTKPYQFFGMLPPATKRSSEDVEFRHLRNIENKSPTLFLGWRSTPPIPIDGDPAVTSSNWPHLDLLQLDHPSTTILESRILTGSGIYTPPPPPATAANQLRLYGLPSRCDTFSAVLFYDGSSSIPCQARNDKYAAFV